MEADLITHPMAKDSKRITAFRCPEGLFDYRVMPFGLSTAPASCERLMGMVLGDVPDCAAAYEDNIFVLSHLSDLERVFMALHLAGLTVKPGKVFLLRRKVDLLRYTLSEAEVKPSDRRVEDLQNFPRPVTKTDV